MDKPSAHNHRMTGRRFLTWLIASSLPLLSGCYESSDVVIHHAGEYQGKRDSTVVLHPNDAQREKLLKRFQSIQTDR